MPTTRNDPERRSDHLRDPRLVGVVDVVVAAVNQVQDRGGETPSLVELVAGLRVDRDGRPGTNGGVGGEVSGAEVAQSQARRKAFGTVQREER